jgi:hypothetical protein
MDIVGLLIDIVILAIVFGLVYWIVTLLPLPEPFKQIAVVAVLLIFLLVLLSVFLGGGSFLPHYRVR